MNLKTIQKLLTDNAYTRTGGSAEELQCAKYIQDRCAEMGLQTTLEAFPVTMYENASATLTVDGKEIPCKGYFGSPTGTVKAKIFYLAGTDPISLSKCKGKIVLSDKPLGYRLYDKLVAHGARGVITYSGNLFFSDHDIDQKEYRFSTEGDKTLFGVNIHVSDAVEIVKNECTWAEITVKQTLTKGMSHNVILDLDGECDETVILSAHYDSTSLSTGVYDNMSGSVTLLYLAEYFSTHPHRRRLRFLWCGSEERGLIGSREYCKMHEDELSNTVLNINLDMLGSIMGEFVIFACADDEMEKYLKRFAARCRYPASIRYAIRSSDSNSFLECGVPAVSFARYANASTALIHTSYDTMDVISVKRIRRDMEIVQKFTDLSLNSPDLMRPITISEQIRSEVEEYMSRKL